MKKTRFSVIALMSATLSMNSLSQQRLDSCIANNHLDLEKITALAKADNPDRGILWKVSKNNIDAYIYGTVHIAKMEWMFPGPVLKKLLSESKTLVVEVDTTQPDFAEDMNKEAIKIQQEEKTKFTRKFKTNLESKIDLLMRNACLPESIYKNSGLSAKVTALEMWSIQDENITPTYSIDNFLIAYEKATRKTVVGLEDANEQAYALHMSPSSLAESVNKLENGSTKQQVYRLVTAWAKRNLDEIENFTESCDCNNNKEEFNRLITDRNRVLTSRFIKVFNEKQNIFAALGILHMTGKNSVLENLKINGFQISRVF